MLHTSSNYTLVYDKLFYKTNVKIDIIQEILRTTNTINYNQIHNKYI